MTAVDDLSFDVAPGEFFGFLGPNGAGKTTTINAIVGLATFQGGNISVFGHDVVTDFRRSRRLVGLSPQEFNFDRFLSVEEILTYQGGYYGMPLSQAKPRARELLEQFELADKRRNSYLELSGGMKRRLSLARALMHRPQLLILDEPTAGMDVELRLELWDFLKAINADGMTIFMTSHYLEEVERLCNRIGIVNDGRLVALENKATLMAGYGTDSLQDVFLSLVGRRTHG
ncbi:MAG TPA: ABC transporter ATP-binding protein [Candidatus Eremiobacteraceae bacterium]|nr:ABC transporter ATP-binding protein [Candidatus Eremiobacteraceae bacterium]